MITYYQNKNEIIKFYIIITDVKTKNRYSLSYAYW